MMYGCPFGQSTLLFVSFQCSLLFIRFSYYSPSKNSKSLFTFIHFKFTKCCFHPHHRPKSCMHYKRTERREMMIPLFPFLLSCLRFTIGLAWTIHLQQQFPDQQHKYCWSGARLPLSQTGNARFPPILSSVPLFISRYQIDKSSSLVFTCSHQNTNPICHNPLLAYCPIVLSLVIVVLSVAFISVRLTLDLPLPLLLLLLLPLSLDFFYFLSLLLNQVLDAISLCLKVLYQYPRRCARIPMIQPGRWEIQQAIKKGGYFYEAKRCRNKTFQ